ncbi:hypothetical protein CANARDRAFT_27965, partial [[Candida] arabinofermentans NRRL YB-2248]
MVVLAAAICSRGGKALLSRQFRDLSKDRVTALLSALPSLLSDSSKSQHTTVEDENVRYVYQPLEECYVVLITNKHSNILQDIDTLHLFTQVITSILRTVDEREIFDNSFEILHAFDEIVTLGYRENLSLSQIVTFLEMDSHEEKIQEIIERNKELEAAEERKRKAKEIQRREMMMKNNSSFEFQQSQNFIQPSYQQAAVQPEPVNPYQSYEPEPSRAATRSGPKKGGLQLGKKPSVLSSDSQPLLTTSVAPSQQQSHSSVYEPVEPQQKEKTDNNGILLVINEKFTAQITREGAISSAEVKGDLQLRINDASLAHSKINLEMNHDKSKTSTQYKTHPNVDKMLFTKSGSIGLKDSTKPFPSNDKSLGVLRWKISQKADVPDDENILLPIMLTTWVNSNDGSVNLTFEYECLESSQVDEVVIVIPISEATVSSSENDNCSITFVDEGVLVKLTDLQEFPSGSFEVECNGVDDEEALFPIELYFNASKHIEQGESACGVVVSSIISTETEEELPFDTYYNASNEGYYI